MRKIAFAAGFVVLGIVPACAAPERGNADLKRYCTGDAVTFCAGLDPNSKEMDSCFKTHRAELSENCRRAIDVYEASGGR